MHDSKSPTQTTWPATLSVAMNDIWANNFGFTVSDDAAGLHLSHVYIAGSYLYIENTDDSPVIDLTTMAKVSSKWRLRPLDTIGGQWTLVSKGHVTNDYTDCFGTDTTFLCYERGQLIRDTNGAYTGPWY
ncbi:hypothetical protein [Nocardia sp. NPDC004711]